MKLTVQIKNNNSILSSYKIIYNLEQSLEDIYTLLLAKNITIHNKHTEIVNKDYLKKKRNQKVTLWKNNNIVKNIPIQRISQNKEI